MTSASVRPRRLAIANVVVSVALLIALGVAYASSESILALAQAADSFADALTGAALLFSLRLAAKPPDDEHPLGRRPAEPITSLMTAMLACGVSVEVLRSAYDTLMNGGAAQMSWLLLSLFVVKLVAKLAITVATRSARKDDDSPVLSALHMDARNDALLSALSIVGFVVAREGGDIAWDVWFAIPVALWIGYAGVDLARENIALLMGRAPDAERCQQLKDVARDVRGVRSVHGLKALYVGNKLHVMIDVVVDPESTLRDAHALGHEVETALLSEDDVVHALARLDLHDDEAADEKRVEDHT